MAVHEQTYVAWTGATEPRVMRGLSIFASGFRVTWRSLLVKVFLLFIFMIVTFWLGFLILAAQAQLPPIFSLGNRIYRENFFAHPMFLQLIMVVTAVAGAGLIALDRRANAFAMYFSKAITRRDYILSKYLILIAFIGLGTFLPAMLLWFGQMTIGQETFTVMQHYSDLSAVFAHSLAIAMPCAAVVLMYSSLSSNPYVPAILWIATYEGTEIISVMLDDGLDLDWGGMLSLRRLTDHLGNMFYEWRPVEPGLIDRMIRARGSKEVLTTGMEHDVTWSPYLCAFLLIVITLGSLFVVARRLRSFEARG